METGDMFSQRLFRTFILPVLHPSTHGSKKSSVEPDDRPTKCWRCDGHTVCDLSIEIGDVPQSGGNAPGFVPFLQEGSGLGIVDLPKSSHRDAVETLPNCDDSPSVGGTNGGYGANDNDAERVDPRENEEDTIAFCDSAGLMDCVISYDDLGDSGNDD
ncbi:hypothetical protein PC118_g14288 [Phytophthora cactorum]|uniref:Uncharacterized protein n=1 Tax=Phytophthora cactorum TaxID=29920 RepID=A0A329RT63_9STRA|nr:hypothetical protein PC118_g14288 [Phytophthora cactorum]RAW26756.1 hypothetical protein PC110_g16843 [Phytophthora cactorum]